VPNVSSDIGAGTRKGVAAAGDPRALCDAAGELKRNAAPAVDAIGVAAVGVAGAAVGGWGVVGGSGARRVALAEIMRWKMTGIWAPG
jgi:hypothetical protein